MSAGATILRHRTALSRSDLSRPMRIARSDAVLAPGASLMDYGCGRGGDVARLRRDGFECDGWDPVHAPEGVRREADVVNLGYVVNVIERPEERANVLRAAFRLTRRVLVVSARLAAEQSCGVLAYGDGALTRRQTFQKFYEQQELKAWIESVLDTPAIAAAPGIFYVFRDPVVRSEFLASRFRRSAPRPRLDPTRLYTALRNPQREEQSSLRLRKPARRAVPVRGAQAGRQARAPFALWPAVERHPISRANLHAAGSSKLRNIRNGETVVGGVGQGMSARRPDPNVRKWR